MRTSSQLGCSRYAQLFNHSIKWLSPPITVFLKNGPTPASFSLFYLFKHTLQFLQHTNVKQCPSSKRCRDLTSQPLDRESCFPFSIYASFCGKSFDSVFSFFIMSISQKSFCLSLSLPIIFFLFSFLLLHTHNRHFEVALIKQKTFLTS